MTRELVCELVAVDELAVPIDALAAAREAFLASTTRDVQPVAAVDGEAREACPGPLTAAAQKAFAALLARDLDP